MIKFTRIRTLKDQKVYLDMYVDYCNELNRFFDRELSEDSARFAGISYIGEEMKKKATVDIIRNKNDDAIGFIIVSNSKVVPPPSKWYIAEFYIKPEYRKQGYGSCAIEEFQKEHTGYVSLHIIKNNDAAKRFWEHIWNVLGWKDCSTDGYTNFLASEKNLDFYIKKVRKVEE